MKLVVLLELSAAALLMMPWSAHGATFRWANTSNRIYVENGGSATLSDIKTALPNAPLDLVDPVNRVWLLRANLLIVDGSVLVLHGAAAGGDVNEFRLQSNNSSDSNSFVSVTADWGGIDIKNARITSWDVAANGPDTEFEAFGRAFVRVRSRLAADGVTPQESRMDIVDSDVSYLGYDASESYGLTWKVMGTHPDPTKSIFDYVNVYGNITGSRLHHNFWGVYSFGLEGARWLNNEIDHNAGYGFDPHDDSDHLVIEGNNVHHNGGIGRGVHGIIASKRCDHLVIRNNRSWANAGNGIMLHRHGDDALIEGNQSFLNGDSGIALFDSDRSTVRNNLVLSNGNAGIRLSVGCTDSVIAGNEIAYSGGNGLYFYPGTDPAEPDPVDPTVTNRSRRNTMASNYVHHCRAEGIKMTDCDENVFIGNEFSANARELFFLTSTQTRLVGNAIPPTAIVALFGTASGPNTTFFEQQPLVTLALSNAYVSATFEDDAGAVFAVGQSSVATHVDNQHSFVTLTTTEIGAGATVTTRDLFVGLNAGEALISVNPTLWGSGGEVRKQWASQANTATASIRYTVGDLSPNRPYTILKNGQALSSVTSDSSGQVSFTDVPGTTAAVQYAIAPGGTPPPLPMVTIVASDPNASEAGPDPGTFTVSRTGSTAAALTVTYSVGGTAVNGADYATLPGRVTMSAGSPSANITVSPWDGTGVEGNETVILTLSTNAAYAVGTPRSATVTIADNDQPTRPTVTVVASDPNASEAGPNPGTFTVSRTGSTVAALTVTYSVGGTAVNGADYAALPGSVNIPAGSPSANITVSPFDGTGVEGSETVILTLSTNAAYLVGSPRSATVTIADNDQPTRPTVTIVASDPNASEAGPNPGTFTVSRTGSTAAALAVTYSVGGTAVNGADYAALPGSVNIPAGSPSANITVNPMDGTGVEGNETVILTLSTNAAYAVGTPRSATVTIADNDQPPALPTVTVVDSDGNASESGANTGSFRVTRTGSMASALTVRYSLGGSAVNGADYSTLPGSVTIPAGSASATIVVNTIDDSAVEGSENVVLTLSASAAYVIGSPNRAVVDMEDNDREPSPAPTVTVLVADMISAESGPDPGTFTISRTGSTASSLIVRYSLGGTAVNGTDYTRLSGAVTIPAGSASAAVVVQPINDSSIELAELVTLTLTADAAYDVNALLNTATLTLLDNDLLGLDSAMSLAPVLVVSPPVASKTGQTDRRLAITWDGSDGQRYQLQYKSDWNATNWIDLGSVITATNGTVMTSDVVGSDAQRFYRVVVLP